MKPRIRILGILIIIFKYMTFIVRANKSIFAIHPGIRTMFMTFRHHTHAVVVKKSLHHQARHTSGAAGAPHLISYLISHVSYLISHISYLISPHEKIIEQHRGCPWDVALVM